MALASAAGFAQDTRALYLKNCANCHGSDGRGQTPLGRELKLPSLRSSEIESLANDDLVRIIAKGAADGKMPGFQKKLGSDAVEQLATYVHGIERQPESQPTNAVSAKTKANPADARSVYSVKCANCHGADGSGQTALGREMKIRDLRSSESRNIPDAVWESAIAHGWDGGRMPGFQKKLGSEMVEHLASYTRILAGKTPSTNSEPLASPAATDGEKPQDTHSPAVADGNTREPSTAASTSDIIRPNPVTTNPEPALAPLQAIPANAPASSRILPAHHEAVDLNSASKESLMTVLGLTETDALKIINGRPYKSTLQFKIRGVVDTNVYDQIAGRVFAKTVSKKHSQSK